MAGLTHDEAISKVRKLLALAQSDNANEAANAAARAQEIMDKYSLQAAMLEMSDPASQPEEQVKEFADPLVSGKFIWRWKTVLAMHVSKVNGCTLYNAGGAIKIIGRPSDAATVRYMFAYIVNEVERLGRRDCAGEGLTYSNNFKLGCVDTIGARLQEQHQKFGEQAKAEAGTAIVLVTAALAKVETRLATADAFMRRAVPGLHKTHAAPTRYDHTARNAGRQAGREVQLNGGRAALGSAQRALGQ